MSHALYPLCRWQQTQGSFLHSYTGGKKKSFDLRIVRKQSINTSSLLRDMILGCFGMRYRALLTYSYTGNKKKKEYSTFVYEKNQAMHLYEQNKSVYHICCVI